MTRPTPSSEDVFNSAVAVEVGKTYGVPMDMIDGRPWVRTHDETHLPEVWGRPCLHLHCGGGSGRITMRYESHITWTAPRPADWPNPPFPEERDQ